jgi:hypothetical protein
LRKKESMEAIPTEEGGSKKTSACARRMSCLSSDAVLPADVQYCLEGRFLFVDCTREDCPSRIHHGYYGTICACPLRRERFLRHGR